MANPLDRMRKLNSRLRCVANGDSNVNAVRAQQNGAVRLKPAAQKLKVPDIVSLTTDDSVKQLKREIDAIARGPKQKDLPNDVEVSVFVLLNRESAKSPDLVTRRNGRVGTATVSIADLQKLDSDPVVQSIELAETLRAPDPQIGANTPSQPSADRYVLYNSGTVGVAGKNRTIDDIGKNVLIGIIDVGGIDFAHEDFMDDAGNSRIIRIWDQGRAHRLCAERSQGGAGITLRSCAAVTANPRFSCNSCCKHRCGPLRSLQKGKDRRCSPVAPRR
ncbi:hypothetical protein [Rhizobium leguminosarum]|uniref:hypothetical protein n=1 Tax=Rhizobium leguminosarum TaxID=384 RepID=UPI0028C4E54F|nr:hypothetical protein [Rhizobium leguminosarum]